MIKRDTLKVIEASGNWSVTLPEGASKGRILGVYSSEGDKLSYESDDFKGGVLSVNFGFEAYTGEMDYEYEDGKVTPETPLDGSTTPSNMTFNITNTNTNNNGGTASPQQ